MPTLKLGAELPNIFLQFIDRSATVSGAKGMEAEFPDKVPKIGNTYITESASASLNLVLIAIGYLKAVNK